MNQLGLGNLADEQENCFVCRDLSTDGFQGDSTATPTDTAISTSTSELNLSYLSSEEPSTTISQTETTQPPADAIGSLSSTTSSVSSFFE